MCIRDSVCAGPTTNQSFLRRAVTHPNFVAEDIDTGFIGRHEESLIREDADTLRRALIAATAEVFRLRHSDALETSEAGGEPGSPWSVPNGWRVNLASRESLVFRCGEEELSVAVVYSDKEIDLELPDGSRASLPQDIASGLRLSLIHISEPTRLGMISYAVFCLKK